MISVAAPLWLLALAVGPVIWWLHRASGHGLPVAVASVLLFREVPAARSGGARGSVTDPAWRRRVAIAVLLTLALAGLTLRGATRDLIVWVDDGPTMATREGGVTRLAAGFAALRSALPHDPTARIELRSLAEPGLHYEVNAPAPVARAREARVPAAAALPNQAAQWLLTDGANGALETWARGGAIERVVRVGTETENVGVVALAARARLSDPERLDGSVTIINAGRKPARRDLVLRLGRELVLRQSLDLSPGQQRELDFSFPRPAHNSGGLEALISPGDALPDDDQLELDAGALERRRVRVGIRCPEALRNAVAALADLELATTAGGADLAITCEADAPAEAPVPSLPTLALTGRTTVALPNREHDARVVADPAWSPLATAALSETLLPRIMVVRDPGTSPPPDAEPLLRSSAGTLAWRRADSPRRVETRIDLGASALAGATEYPLLVGELLELAIGEPLIARVAAAERDPRTLSVAPATAAALAATPDAGGAPPVTALSRGTRPSRPLAPLLCAIAGALILWDLALRLQLTIRLLRAETNA